jgi:hypothetical protein
VELHDSQPTLVSLHSTGQSRKSRVTPPAHSPGHVAFGREKYQGIALGGGHPPPLSFDALCLRYVLFLAFLELFQSEEPFMSASAKTEYVGAGLGTDSVEVMVFERLIEPQKVGQDFRF